MSQVLFVDDDEANLVVCEAAIGDRFDLITEQDPERALEILRSREIAVLVTDQRMPRMSGAELCARAKEDSPLTIRVLITAYSDLKAAIDAINLGQVRRYLRKPWEPDELAAELRDAMEVYELGKRLRVAEQRARETERVYSIAVMSAGLAHEIRNPLSWVVHNSQYFGSVVQDIKQSLADGGDLRKAQQQLSDVEEALTDLQLGVKRILDIVKRVEAPLLRADPAVEQVDMGEVVALAIKLIDPELARRASIEVEKTGSLLVSGSSTELSQIVLNLVDNALRALPPGQRSKCQVKIRLVGEDEQVRMHVVDNGPGVAPEILPRIFEPFFTTREAGGTGLGLPISRTIAAQLGGELSAENGREGGAHFILSLPARLPTAGVT